MTATITCSVCYKPFDSDAPRAESWYKVHPRTHEERYKRGCLCCSCRRWRDAAKADIEIMPPDELHAALAESKRNGKPWAYAAFCAMANAMLSPGDLVALKTTALVDSDAKLCRVRADHSEIVLDCETLDALRALIGTRGGRIFTVCERSIANEWHATTKAAKLYAYRLMALRHTGIAMRGTAVRTMAELVTFKREARIRTWGHLRIYIPDAKDLTGYYERVIKASGR